MVREARHFVDEAHCLESVLVLGNIGDILEMILKRSLEMISRRSLRGVVLTNVAKHLPRRHPAKAREAPFVDEGGVVAIFWLNSLARRHVTNA